MTAKPAKAVMNKPEEHPALNKTWWMNLYPDGQCTGTLCETLESALNRSTYTEETPDSEQVEVRIIPISQPTPELSGLRYALAIIANRRVRKSTPDYLAALDEMEIFIQAAIERVKNGESMHSEAVTQGAIEELKRSIL